MNDCLFHFYVESIYPQRTKYKSFLSWVIVLYLDILLWKKNINGNLTTKLNDERVDFKFSIINVPYFCSIIHHLHIDFFLSVDSMLKGILFVWLISKTRQCTGEQVYKQDFLGLYWSHHFISSMVDTTTLTLSANLIFC